MNTYTSDSDCKIRQLAACSYEDAMYIDTRLSGTAFIIELDGELNYSSYLEFDKHIARAVGEKAGRVVINMEKLTHIDSMGLGALTRAWKSTDHIGATLVLTGVQPNVLKMIKLINIDSRMKIVDSLAKAIE